jgi:hypothetical protein
MKSRLTNNFAFALFLVVLPTLMVSGILNLDLFKTFVVIVLCLLLIFRILDEIAVLKSGCNERKNEK